MKLAPTTSQQQQNMSTLSAQITSSTEAQFRQLLQDLSSIESSIQQQQLSIQEMRLNDLSADFQQQLNSSVALLIQHMFEDALVSFNRSLDQELSLNALSSNFELQLNSAVAMLTQQLVQDFSANIDTMQQLNTSLHRLVDGLQSQVMAIQQNLDALSTNLGQQLNSSVIMLTQQQLQDSSTNRNAMQQLNMSLNQLNTSLVQLVNGLQTQVMEIIAGGLHPTFPIPSCVSLPPSSPSGYYWVRTTSCSSVRVYCDMTRTCGNITGGWTRVFSLDMTDNSQQCPNGLRERTDANLRTCGVASEGETCSQIFLPTNRLHYSRVCGRIRGYQVGSADSFGNTGRGTNLNIDQNYVDGISLTHGSPRQHIWTFAAGLDERGTFPQFNCPCTNINLQTGNPPIPSFVGSDYFCDTGASGMFRNAFFYSDDPLWDGAGCGPMNTCCSFNTPPWFYKQLPQSTTNDIEMRMCRDQHAADEDSPIDMMELYIQ